MTLMLITVKQSPSEDRGCPPSCPACAGSPSTTTSTALYPQPRAKATQVPNHGEAYSVLKFPVPDMIIVPWGQLLFSVAS